MPSSQRTATFLCIKLRGKLHVHTAEGDIIVRILFAHVDHVRVLYKLDDTGAAKEIIVSRLCMALRLVAARVFLMS